MTYQEALANLKACVEDLETALQQAEPEAAFNDPFAEEEQGPSELEARVAKLETMIGVHRPTFAALEQRVKALEAWKKAQEDLASDMEMQRRQESLLNQRRESFPGDN